MLLVLISALTLAVPATAESPAARFGVNIGYDWWFSRGAIGTYSQAVVADGTVYLSGQIPLDPDSMNLVGGDIRDQIRRVFDNLAAVADAAGAGLDDAVKLTVYLVDLGDFAAVNEIMTEYFSEPYPARAAVQVAALPKGALVEIDLVAILHRNLFGIVADDLGENLPNPELLHFVQIGNRHAHRLDGRQPGRPSLARHVDLGRENFSRRLLGNDSRTALTTLQRSDEFAREVFDTTMHAQTGERSRAHLRRVRAEERRCHGNVVPGDGRGPRVQFVEPGTVVAIPQLTA